MLIISHTNLEFVLLLLVETLLFTMAFTRKCHPKHSGIQGYCQGRAPGSSNQDEQCTDTNTHTYATDM